MEDVRHIFELGELFERVQMEKIFPDGKTFVDCTPQTDLQVIKQEYESQKNHSLFDLSTFVKKRFILPANPSTEYKSEKDRSIIQHIEKLWDVLTRQPETTEDSLIPLPHSYIVPGGRFREIYYWDSYFTMLGLQVSKRTDMIENMVNNFSYLIDRVGYIPNGNRTYFIGRSQPPFYSCMVKLLSEEKGKSVLIDYLPQLEKEYNFWMKGSELLNSTKVTVNRVAQLPDGSVLNHYWDENATPRPESYKEDVELAKNVVGKKNLYKNLRAACESGWDFSSRWLKNVNDFTSIHTSEIIPVDLNCLLLHLEETITDAYKLANNRNPAELYTKAAQKRKIAIQKYCWNEEKQFYFDYDYAAGEQKQLFTLASVFPLFFKIATTEQANAVLGTLRNNFLNPGGLITTLETTLQQWDAPNGWAPLHYIAVKGLLNYSHKELANDIASRWMSINEKVYYESGKLMEKYNATDPNVKAGGGEYPAQDGFGWTNGVYLKLHQLFNEN